MAAVPVEDVLWWSTTQDGDRYVFGAEVPLSASDSDQWDCSELVEWSCGKAGVRPIVPDGAYYQWKHCRTAGKLIPVAEGIATRGALLFVGSGKGTGRNAITHVAWSLGDGTTIEARGTRWGVGSWPSAGRFDFAGLVPGIEYRSPYYPPTGEDDDVAGSQKIVWLAKTSGRDKGNHAYIVKLGTIALHLDRDALNALRQWRVPEDSEPRGREFQHIVAILNGPCKNV